MHDLAGAYAVDALDPEETRAFEEHLRGCAACAAEVRSMRAALTELAVADAVTPPPALRAAVMAEIARTPQEAPVGNRRGACATTRARTCTRAAAGAGAGDGNDFRTRPAADPRAALAALDRRASPRRPVSRPPLRQCSASARPSSPTSATSCRPR